MVPSGGIGEREGEIIVGLSMRYGRAIGPLSVWQKRLADLQPELVWEVKEYCEWGGVRMEGGCGVSHGGEVVWWLILISEGVTYSPTGRVMDKDTRREGKILLLDCLDGSRLLRSLGSGILMNTVHI